MSDSAAPLIVITEARLREIISEALELTPRQEASDILTAEQAAELVKCSIGHVQKLAREGLIPAHNIGLSGSDWRFSRKEIDAWLKDLGTKPLKATG
jgi:excisionase family DNA binding protein